MQGVIMLQQEIRGIFIRPKNKVAGAVCIFLKPNRH
jgi:hypothetical protein